MLRAKVQELHYPIGPDSKGLFVIIANTKFPRRGDNLSRYEVDIKRLTTMFNLKGEDGKYLPNVKVGVNLINNNSERMPRSASNEEDVDDGAYRNCRFDDFMENQVYSYKPDEKPSFVMCFIMTHGNDKNGLQLANSFCDSECRDGIHLYKDCCQWRNYYDSILKGIGRIKTYYAIPKIYFMQICRGKRHSTLDGQAAAGPSAQVPKPSSVPPATDEYTAQNADQYIVYPSAYDHLSFVTDEGSRLIEALEKASNELLRRIPESKELLNELIAKLGERPQKNLDHLLLLENFANGWMENIGTDVRALVPNRLFKHGHHALADKSQPECISTLRYRLSWIDMLTTQKILQN